MTPDRWATIERLYHLALDQPAGRRDAFLDASCAGDADLRREIARLLAHDDADDGWLDGSAMTVAAQTLAGDQAQAHARADLLTPDHVVGHYRIVRRLGQGGMGEVLLADDLTLGRRVALKFLAPDAIEDEDARSRLVREARAASALTHPHIVTVHAVEEADGRTFIVMEYVEGDTLEAVLRRGRLPIARVLELGVQVAEGLSAAHLVGLIHRDIKPANIVITATGHAKILDFGIARRWRSPGDEASATSGTALPGQTAAGLIHGTVSYMSPEQARGAALDPRADLFSLGAVLYEAATGTRPFQGPDEASILRSIATATPELPSARRPDLPQEFDVVIARALAKAASSRFASTLELADALRALQGLDAIRSTRRVRRWLIGAAAVLLVVTGSLGALFVRASNRRWAATAVVEVERLAVAGRYREGYALAEQAARYLPQDAALARLRLLVADSVSVVSEPAGARVFLTSHEGGHARAGGRQLLGTTPLAGISIARDDYLIEIEKDGYVPARRTISSALLRTDRAVFDPSAATRHATFSEDRPGDYRLRLDAPGPIAISTRLIPSAGAPAGMVFVPGGRYGLTAVGKPLTATVTLDDYFIDRLEVTNRAFREFIEAGGYVREAWWTEPITMDGRVLAPAEAMPRFRDRTGRPGPRSWADGTYPSELADHPVTDISWYEAAAYAAFRGARLPTVFQWEKAARDGQVARVLGFVMPWGLVDAPERLNGRANFLGTGTMPADAFPFGVSPYGAHQMAGNVAEWCLNAQPGGRTVAGGSWQDPLYLFGNYGSYPALHTASTIGFRTVRAAARTLSDQGAMPVADAPTRPAPRPVDDRTFRTLLSHYHYDRTPLDARVTAVQDAPDWTRERLSYLGAGGARASAYLYLPRKAARPLQVVHYVPSDAVIYGLTAAEEVEALLTPIVRAGRAVFTVINQGFSERPFQTPDRRPDVASVRYREVLVQRAIDLQRGIDYLTTRPDLDASRIAAFGTSIWSSELIPFAVERRYRSIVLLAAGMPATEARALPEANAINFLPRFGAPTLMMLGRHDESISYRHEGEPAFALLPTPKRLQPFDGGHMPPLAAWIPVATAWLDDTLGPTRR